MDLVEAVAVLTTGVLAQAVVYRLSPSLTPQIILLLRSSAYSKKSRLVALQPCNFAKPGGLDSYLLYPSRAGITAQRLNDRQLRRFGTGRLAYMQAASVGTEEGGDDPALPGEGVRAGSTSGR